MATKKKMLQAAAGNAGGGGFIVKTTSFNSNTIKSAVDTDGNIYSVCYNSTPSPDTAVLTKFNSDGDLQWDVEIANSLASTNYFPTNLILLSDGNVAIDGRYTNSGYPQHNSSNIRVYNTSGVLQKNRLVYDSSHQIAPSSLDEDTSTGDLYLFGTSYRSVGNVSSAPGMSQLRFRASDLVSLDVGSGSVSSTWRHRETGQGSQIVVFSVHGFSPSTTSPFGSVNADQSSAIGLRLNLNDGLAMRYIVRFLTSHSGTTYKIQTSEDYRRPTRIVDVNWYDGKFLLFANCQDSATPIFGGSSITGLCLLSMDPLTNTVGYQYGFPGKNGPIQSGGTQPNHNYTVVKDDTLYIAYNISTLDSSVYYDHIHVMSVNLINGSLNYHYILERQNPTNSQSTIHDTAVDDEFIYLSGTQDGTPFIIKLPVDDLGVGGTLDDFSILDYDTLDAAHPLYNQFTWTQATNTLPMITTSRPANTTGTLTDGGTSFGTETDPTTYVWDVTT